MAEVGRTGIGADLEMRGEESAESARRGGWPML
jgi:hypothetical protein